MSDREGQQFGNYKLISFLGNGSFADVYLGEHIYLKKPLAVKLLRARLPTSDIESFFIEARTIASLEHPNIVQVLDCGVDHNIPFLVMNYASNGTLRQRHPNHIVLSPTVVLSYVKPIASALQYAHDRKLIHRDIKPQNILLGPNDELWLSDFGLVVVSQSTKSQITQNTAGTPVYMAPEQFRGKPRPASDQYALAVVVYEWLCGERPFQGSYYELFSQHNDVSAPSLREKLPTISPAIEEVVLTALAKDPHKRFSSVQAFANALEQAYKLEPYLLPGTDVDLLALSSQKGLPPAGQSGTFLVALATSTPTLLTPIGSLPSAQNGIAIALDESSLVSEEKRDPGPNTPAPIEMFREPSTPLPSVHPQSQALPKRGISRRRVLAGLVGAIALVSGATTLAWEYASHSNGSTATPPPPPIKVQSHATTATPTPVPVGTPILIYHGQKDGVKAAEWSSNGQYIASGSVDKTVHVWDATTGKDLPFSPYAGHIGNVITVAWSPNSTRFASASLDGTVGIWSLANRQVVFLTPPFSHIGERAVAWSPHDGKYIVSGGDDNKVSLWDATTEQLISTSSGHTDSVQSVAWSPDGQHIASGSFDGTVKIWSFDRRKIILTYHHQTKQIWSVAWSPDGKRIASASTDGTVHIWKPLD